MCDYCSWIEKLLRPTREETPAITVCTNVIKNQKIAKDVEKTGQFEPTILMHGSATSVSTRGEMDNLLESIEEATIKGYRELLKGAETVDCIELAIGHLEKRESISDSITESKSTENKKKVSVIKDAAIMDSDSNFGSVGATINVPHPINLAKRVLRNTEHVLIVGNGTQKLEFVSDDVFDTENCNGEKDGEDSIASKRDEQYEMRGKKREDSRGLEIYGAIARDKKGRLACGVSTFDDREEMIQRSSMSATGTVIGCGIFADADSCCSVSGKDTAIYAYAPARRVVERLKRGAWSESSGNFSIDEALQNEIGKFRESTGETSIGIAALSIEGEARVAFEANYFPWACCNRGLVTSGCIKDEVSTTKEVKDLDMPLDCQCN